MKIIAQLCLQLVLVAIIFSCASPEKIIYFQGDLQEKDNSNQESSPTLQTGDLISVTVSTLDMDAVKPFNLSDGTLSGDDTQRSGATYSVDDQGNIEFPVLGSIEIAGKTTSQAMIFLKEKLRPYLMDPIVNVKLRNFRITVLGEVNNPGTFEIPSEHITVPQALGLAGDLTINGVRTNILIIRETNEKRSQIRLDLTSSATLNSPYYFLKQNDVIYVEPNQAKMNSSEVSPNIPIFLSIITLIVTTTVILLTRN